jgi:serpin B
MKLTTGLTVALACTLMILGGSAYQFLGTPPGHRLTPLARADDSGWSRAGLADISGATNQFALEMYANLSGDGGNVFFSPYSMEAAFAMLYEGARNRTADEIRSVFHFTQDDQLRRASFARMYNAYNPEDPQYVLSTANAVWVQNNSRVLAGYIDTLARYYMASARNVDFLNATEQARQTINGWVAAKTAGRITDLFPSGSLDSLTRLALTNAIYFKGEWVNGFDGSLTRTADFHVDANRTVPVRMMTTSWKDEAKFGFADTLGLQMIRLPYKGDRLSMLVILPTRLSMSEVEGMLSPENLTIWRHELRTEEVRVQLPKFSFKSTYDLKPVLARMGMPSAFEGTDFSGIDGSDDLFVQSAVHQAYIRVNEQGTEAAAATGIGVAAGVPPYFTADHPFIFLIQDDETGNILFMGKVADPTG